MNILDAIIQGTVQGLTEFLPVSSSGHLVIFQHILGVGENNLFFDVMLHVGTLLAVVTFYHKKIFKLIIAFFKLIEDIIYGKFRMKKLGGDKDFVFMLIIGLLPLFLMFLPVAPGAMDVKDFAESLSSGVYIIVPGVSLIITSVLLYIGTKIEKRNTKERKLKKIAEKNKRGYISVYDALWIGLMQFLAAIFPGLSRSGSTLSVGLMRGIDKQTALDYSFILGIPAVVAAALLELKEAFETGAVHEISTAVILVGIIVSAIVGFFAIKLFKWFLNTQKMWIFILYTFILGSIITAIGTAEYLMGVNLFTGARL